MPRYRHALPQTGDTLFASDGGLETTLIYRDGIELPAFASFDLLKNASGTALLRAYFERYAQMAKQHGLGLVLESATWRANPDWAKRLGYDAARLAEANRKAIDLLCEVRDAYETPQSRMVISGNLGPRGDGYVADSRMTAQQAYDYHARQIETFARTEADMVAAFTMNYMEEAIGIVSAARTLALPVAISFTVETDGRLPSGQTLKAAITETDMRTDGYAAYYMINCAHPTHFTHVLGGPGTWSDRIRGIRANASPRSHAELDASTELDAGDPHELGTHYATLANLLPQLTVVGGCCGTDHRHVDSICRALTRSFVAA
jgi:S-methylmethionine-dependent homocysteine/selenocysteine methylase